jgi:hypothetical protein
MALMQEVGGFFGGEGVVACLGGGKGTVAAATAAAFRFLDGSPDSLNHPQPHPQPAHQMQACGEPPPEIVEDMSSAIGAELPPGFMGGGGGGGGGMGEGLGGLGGGLGGLMGGLGGLGGGLGGEAPGLGDLDLPPELLNALPENLRNCPMQ